MAPTFDKEAILFISFSLPDCQLVYWDILGSAEPGLSLGPVFFDYMYKSPVYLHFSFSYFHARLLPHNYVALYYDIIA